MSDIDVDMTLKHNHEYRKLLAIARYSLACVAIVSALMYAYLVSGVPACEKCERAGYVEGVKDCGYIKRKEYLETDP